jgi:putative Mn2+ efflux pump MntP
MLEAVALAFGLAMDATAVAASRGVLGRRNELVILPLMFGLFQAGMALLGWLGARAIGAWFGTWDHWIAFGLLVAIGGKMLHDAWRGIEERAEARAGLVLYLALAVATSIDAAAAGVALPSLGVQGWLAITLIGVVTVATSAVGYVLGRSAGKKLGKRLEVLGGVILVALGVRVLVEHL